MKRVLIVEDHIGLREAYQMLLLREGYEVDLAEDGADGLAMTNEKKYDLILLDMLMPVMPGLDFLRAYKPLEHPETKVVVFSNMQTPETVKETMELGVKKYITKATMPPKEMAKELSAILALD